MRTSAKAISKSKDKLTRLQFLQCLDDYIRPRKSKNNIEMNDIESDNSNDEDEGQPFINDDGEVEHSLKDETEKCVEMKGIKSQKWNRSERCRVEI